MLHLKPKMKFLGQALGYRETILIIVYKKDFRRPRKRTKEPKIMALPS